MKRTIQMLTLVAFIGALMVGCSDDKKVELQVISANDAEGTVSGGGSYDEGTMVTIKAIPNEGYLFDKWQDGNTDNPRQVKAETGAVYVANFKADNTVRGDGSTTVTWNGESWTTKDVFAVQFDNGGVTLEIHKDASDQNAPLLVINVTTAPGTYYAMPNDYSFMCVYFDYPSQTATYNGMQLPPYQPIQGLYMTVTGIDLDNGKISGHLEGSMYSVELYQQGDNTLFSLVADFSATEWIDMTE